jgi:hypothetical protein
MVLFFDVLVMIVDDDDDVSVAVGVIDEDCQCREIHYCPG